MKPWHFVRIGFLLTFLSLIVFNCQSDKSNVNSEYIEHKTEYFPLLLPPGWEQIKSEDGSTKGFINHCNDTAVFCSNITINVLPIAKEQFSQNVCKTYREGLSEVLEEFNYLSCKDTIVNNIEMKIADFKFIARGVSLKAVTSIFIKDDKVFKLTYTSMAVNENEERTKFIKILSSIKK